MVCGHMWSLVTQKNDCPRLTSVNHGACDMCLLGVGVDGDLASLKGCFLVAAILKLHLLLLGCLSSGPHSHTLAISIPIKDHDTLGPQIILQQWIDQDVKPPHSNL